MSLINDALKRAKEVQTNNPPPAADNLHLRPAEPASQPKKSIGLVLPATGVTVVLAALFSFWQLRGGNHAPLTSETEVTARASARHSDALTPRVEPARLESPASSTPALASNSPAIPDVQMAAATNAQAVAQTEPPKPALPQLKAIIFNPRRPSALIDGKTVFVGDKVREFRVTAITPVSATLASLTQTNVLTLE